ncbi:hypothetical protein [uncultured Anaerovibrio sp.]|uniref:hypothetical protein n=1 Tax=uncultured Anaerovibrio sp. TaxID=361586 RepID=UPI00261D0056|nr:hypothetical protein [uncultured Anaerovibrio sp.]
MKLTSKPLEIKASGFLFFRDTDNVYTSGMPIGMPIAMGKMYTMHGIDKIFLL